ncbi:TPM domain-containing protein [Defluviimonas sp. WL0002]|uniref:TPM domain-containing protein n=1 Tax=Albidovulum marisflavi TaxID=2984159 RepID=A0ABT2ZHI0_9RHOB|nr:TPM domain-containing protein [Defluviimonas sp. WL0002]MCV2870561.1 TPM domain-containing protein [Defluviimonas sp. WL0002]
MSRLFLIFSFVFAATIGPLRSEVYPAYSDLFVNDLAEVINPVVEQRIRDELARLKAETSVEATVLTLASRGPYAPDMPLETFATGLFNSWGIGSAERNDGILILVVIDDREMRVELGSAYSQDFDTIAQDIVTRSFLPSFRAGDYGAGMERGVAEIDKRIARRRAANLGPLPETPFPTPKLVPLVAVFLVALYLLRRRLFDFGQRLRACPNCGRRGLLRHRHTLRHATEQQGGIERIRTTCPSCDWSDETERSISRITRKKESAAKFGGGRSSGGGSSGKW